ncbi:MAG: cupin domain-containing protein [Gemmatimonadota bacterium]
MSSTVDALVLDLLEWIGPRPRPYPEVIDAWRTSCPRLPVWEEANERGFVDRQHRNGVGTFVAVTPRGAAFLAEHRPQAPTSARPDGPDDSTKFAASHLRDATFTTDGLRPFFAYRDLGIRAATDGRVVAHVIRAVPGATFEGRPHLHRTSFQFVYVLKGWIEFEYEGQGNVRLEAGSSVYQPPSIRHREIGHSDDVELLEIVMPGDFATEEVEAVQSR